MVTTRHLELEKKGRWYWANWNLAEYLSHQLAFQLISSSQKVLKISEHTNLVSKNFDFNCNISVWGFLFILFVLRVWVWIILHFTKHKQIFILEKLNFGKLLIQR